VGEGCPRREVLSMMNSSTLFLPKSSALRLCIPSRAPRDTVRMGPSFRGNL
jgi:hypothetical protein